MNGMIKLEYVNHLGEKVEIGSGGIYAGSSDLRDYSWTVTQRGNKISRLSRDVTTKKLPILISGETKAESYELRNRLLEVTEKDVLAFEPGKIICGEYYYPCFVTESKKPSYWKGERNLVTELVLTTDRPAWIREIPYEFSAKGGGGATFLDYSYDYPIDFLSSTASRTLNNPGFVGTDFRLIIFGACENPEVVVSGHTYQVLASAEQGEYITIDSREKTIFKTGVDGQQTNLFNSRNKESYIFQRIPAESNPVTWGGEFDFTITILEERSEPKWT